MDEGNLLANDTSTISAEEILIQSWNADVGMSGRALITLLTIYNVFAIIGNLLIIKVVPKISSNAIDESSKVFYLAQAVTDAVAATLYIIGPFSEAIGKWSGWITGRLVYCRVIGFAMTTSPGISILQIAFLNTDRYLYIVSPMFYSVHVTPKRALVATIVNAIFIVVILLVFVSVNEISFGILRHDHHLKACIVDYQEPTFLPFALVMFGMPWLTMLGLLLQYFHIFRISAKHWRRTKPLGNSVDVDPGVCSRTIGNSSGIVVGRVAASAGMVQLQAWEACATDRREDATSHAPISDNGRQFCEETLSTVADVCPGGCSETFHRSQRESIRPSTISGDYFAKASPSRTDAAGLLTQSTARAPPVQPFRHPNRTLRQNIRVIRTPLVITSCFFFSFLPPTFLNIYLAANGRSIDAFTHTCITLLVAINGGVNIIVYYVTIKPFRQILRKMIRGGQ